VKNTMFKKIFAIIVAIVFGFVYWLELKKILKEIKQDTKRIGKENNLSWFDRQIFKTEIQIKAIDMIKAKLSKKCR